MPAPMDTTFVEWLLSGLGSGVDDVAVAVFTMLPEGTVTSTTIVMPAASPTPRSPRSAVTVPVPPTGGPAQVPRFVVHETNVVPIGSGSSRVTATAVSGPALTTLTR